MAINTSVVFPVVRIDGRAYLLLDTIPENSKSPLALDFMSSGEKITFFRNKCESTSSKTTEGEATIYTHIFNPITRLTKGDLITRFSTEEISYSICVSSSELEARSAALEIIKNLGESFSSTSQKVEALTRALTVLHDNFERTDFKRDRTESKTARVVGAVLFGVAAISLLVTKMFT